MIIRRVFAAVLLGLAFAATATAATSTASAELLAVDTPRATPAGTTFTVPAGWALRTTGKFLALDPPEPDSHIVLFDVTAVLILRDAQHEYLFADAAAG
jgi:hypothetical protein